MIHNRLTNDANLIANVHFFLITQKRNTTKVMLRSIFLYHVNDYIFRPYLPPIKGINQFLCRYWG